MKYHINKAATVGTPALTHHWFAGSKEFQLRLNGQILSVVKIPRCWMYGGTIWWVFNQKQPITIHCKEALPLGSTSIWMQLSWLIDLRTSFCRTFLKLNHICKAYPLTQKPTMADLAATMSNKVRHPWYFLEDNRMPHRAIWEFKQESSFLSGIWYYIWFAAVISCS